MNARGVDFTGIAMLVGIGVAAYVGYRVIKGAPSVAGAVGDAVDAAGRAAGAVVEAITPTNPNNIFNRAFQPIADLFIKGGNPDDAPSGQSLLSRFSTTPTTADIEDAQLGADMRALQKRPELLMTQADRDDAELGASLSAFNGAAFVDYSRLRRGVYK